MKPSDIRSLRRSLNLTQGRLARLIGVADYKTVLRWEKGEWPVTGSSRTLLLMLKASPARMLAMLRNVAENNP
jgi:DNA-binding transcriptional regulator YiaG